MSDAAALRDGVEMRWSKFVPPGGGTQEFFSAGVTAPGAFPDFTAELAALWERYEADLKLRGLSEQSELLLRFHLSDAANQAPPLRRLLNGRPASVTDQPPAGGARIALESWHRLSRSASPYFCRMFYSPVERDGGSFEQTRRLFSALDAELASAGGTVALNTVRTWLYCRDVDNNYSGLVRARNEYFDSIGLTSRFIASTGIGGGAEVPSQLAALDALNCYGIVPEQITFLRALEHLSPTARYGVRFERGSRLAFGDRAQLFISGTASIDHEGRVLHPHDVRRQCRRLKENISALLAEGGATLADVRSATIYLRDAADFAAVREELAPDFPVPAVYLRAPVCRPAWLAECECYAVTAAGDGRFAAL